MERTRKKHLNLTIDPQVVRRLQQIAKREGVSLSRLIEREMDRFAIDYLTLIPDVERLAIIRPESP